MPLPPEPGGFVAAEAARRQLTAANIALRRGQLAEAQRAIQDALEYLPDDPAALEMQGDVCLARGDFDGAAAAYRTALDREPGRATAENKLARATLRRSEDQRRSTLGVAYASEDRALMRGGAEEDRGRQTRLAVLSGLLPGLGQLVGGEFVKGAILLIVYGLGCALLAVAGVRPPLSAGTWLSIAILTADWIYAVVDAARAGTTS